MLKTDEVEPVMVQTIPSGCVHLVFYRDENLNIQSKGLQPENLIRGQFSTRGSLVSKGNIDMTAAIFHPLGLSPSVRCSTSKLYNHCIDVGDLENIELDHLKRNTSAESAVEIYIRLTECFFI